MAPSQNLPYAGADFDARAGSEGGLLTKKAYSVGAYPRVRRAGRRVGHAYRRTRDRWADRIAGPPLRRNIPPETVRDRLVESAPVLRRVLGENIVPFWLLRVRDDLHGGFRLNHDPEGRWLGPSAKGAISQARMVWFFSRLHRSDFGNESHLELARHGYRFLCDHFWDDDWGGLFWEVDAAGNVTRPEKDLSAQAFGLYALTEFGQASGDPRARQLADLQFELIEHHAHDPIHGGYREVFGPEWRVVDGDGRDGKVAGHKQANAHLHLIEAYTTYFLWTRKAAARDRLFELIVILVDTMVDHVLQMGLEHTRLDWTPMREGRLNRVRFGHDLERIWMAGEACRAIELPERLMLPRFQALFRQALRFGYDRRQGGFFEWARFGEPVQKREKVWWVQAEALVTGAYLYALTGDSMYGLSFLETLDWVVRHQVDWEHGDWHAYVDRQDSHQGLKASAVKTPYHNGRSMLMCLEYLDEALHLAPGETSHET